MDKLDKITVHGLNVFAYHGVKPEEKANGQNFILDIVASIDLTKACISDKLEDTVSYSDIIREATKVFTEQKDDLIERAAMRVADGILERFRRIKAVRITVRKPDAPIKADFDYVSVEFKVER